MKTEPTAAKNIKVNDTVRTITGDTATVLAVSQSDRPGHLSVKLDNGWSSDVQPNFSLNKVVD